MFRKQSYQSSISEDATISDNTSDISSSNESITETSMDRSSKPPSRNKTLRSKVNEKINLIKSIKVLKEEDSNIMELLQTHNPYQYKSKHYEGSATEKYLFFCESLVPNSVELPEVEQQSEPTAEIDTKCSSDIVIYKKPQSVKEQLVESYEKMICIPKSNHLEYETSSSGRDLEDEGIFISLKPPTMSNQALHVLQQRLLLAEEKIWFDSSGNIKFEETNYLNKAYRPDGYLDKKSFGASYQLPAKSDFFNDPESISVEAEKYLLEIFIHRITFQTHPLFSKEHVLQAQLIDYVSQHTKIIKSIKRETLLRQLRDLRLAKEQYTKTKGGNGDMAEGSDQGEPIHEELNKRIHNIRTELYERCISYRENVKNILVIWKKIKKLREEQKFSNTSIKLVITKRDQILRDDLEIAWDEYTLEQEDYNKSNKKVVKRTRAQFERLFDQAFGPLNEPEILLNINYLHPVTQLEAITDPMEKDRRIEINKQKFCLELYWGDIYICKTKSVVLEDCFTAIIDATINLQLSRVDQEQSLELKIMQLQNWRFKHLCSLKFKVPQHSLSTDKNNYEELRFSNNSDTNNSTTGFVTIYAGWGHHLETATNKKRNKLISNTKRNDIFGIIDKDEDIDPEDPRCSEILSYLGGKCDITISQMNDIISNSGDKSFQCDPFTECFTICDAKTINENIRIQLLQLRDRNEPEFADMIIPNRLNEIPTNVFAAYKRRVAEERYNEYFEYEENSDEASSVISHRSLGRKYYRQICLKLYQACRNSENHLTFEDIVDEKMIPWIQSYLKTLMANISNWFRWKPNINKELPSMPLPNTESSGNLNSSSVYIFLHIKGAHHLPIQSAAIKTKNSVEEVSDSEGDAIYGYYIHVTFRDFTAKSSCVSGITSQSAVWNEIIRIPMNTIGMDYLNSDALSGTLLVDLFCIMGIEKPDGEEDKRINILLAVLEIPISAIITNGTFEGVFTWNTLPKVFGFEKHQETTNVRSASRSLPAKNESTIELSFRASSTVPRLHLDASTIESNESPYMRDHILGWNNKFNLDHVTRKFCAFAIDTNCKSVCLTRFLKPLEPPQLNLDGFEVTLEQCLRYVSLIPSTNNNHVYQNIWLTAEQMLKLGIGSMVDHAVLLTCFLMSLNYEVWLLLGFGIPKGQSAYVLLKEPPVELRALPNYVIIDAGSGLKYNQTDVNCPLKKVHCIVSQSNIWANLQMGDDISTVRFDVAKRFDWSPLFNNKVTAPTNSAQKVLRYVHTRNSMHLHSIFEKKVQHKFAKLRSHDITPWNHHISRMLSKIVKKAEVNFMHNKAFVHQTQEMIEFNKSHYVFGYLQYVPFTSVNDIVSAIARTKLHQIVDPSAEFASAINVTQYANKVIAVWIALVCIIKK